MMTTTRSPLMGDAVLYVHPSIGILGTVERQTAVRHAIVNGKEYELRHITERVWCAVGAVDPRDIPSFPRDKVRQWTTRNGSPTTPRSSASLKSNGSRATPRKPPISSPRSVAGLNDSRTWSPATISSRICLLLASSDPRRPPITPMTLSQRLRLSERTVREYLLWLARHGMISRVKLPGRGGPSGYRANERTPR